MDGKGRNKDEQAIMSFLRCSFVETKSTKYNHRYNTTESDELKSFLHSHPRIEVSTLLRFGFDKNENFSNVMSVICILCSSIYSFFTLFISKFVFLGEIGHLRLTNSGVHTFTSTLSSTSTASFSCLTFSKCHLHNIMNS